MGNFTPSSKSIAVVGAGAWGGAFGALLRRSGQQVMLWDRSPKYDGIVTNLLECNRADYIVIAIPLQVIRRFLSENPSFLHKEQKVIILSKGIECDTLCLPHEILLQCRQNSGIALVSGPNFAHEVEVGLPACSTIATLDEELRSFFLSLNSNIRFLASSDILGVALCGAVKNVIAIACGAIEAAYGSYNMQVAFIMRVIEELKGIIVKCGGDEETVYSPAGIGDIILTATSTKSRNYRFGQTLVLNGALSIRPLNELAPVKQVLTGVEFPKSSNDGVNHDMTVEGRDTATALKGFLLRYELSFPAIFEVVKIIERGIILEDELFKICK